MPHDNRDGPQVGSVIAPIGEPRLHVRVLTAEHIEQADLAPVLQGASYWRVDVRYITTPTGVSVGDKDRWLLSTGEFTVIEDAP